MDTDRTDWTAELERLAELAFSGRADPEERARLAELAERDPAARAELLRMADIERLLPLALEGRGEEERFLDSLRKRIAAERDGARFLAASRVRLGRATRRVLGRSWNRAGWLAAAAAVAALGATLAFHAGSRPHSRGTAVANREARSGQPLGPRVLARIAEVGVRPGAEPPGLLRAAGERPAAMSGLALMTGDSIDTAGGTLAIEYPGEATRLRLRPGTRLTLQEESGAKRVRLDLGGLAASVAPQPGASPMVFVTPHARATVLGTELALSVSETSTRLDVERGLVRLERSREAVDVKTGEYALAAEGVELAARPLVLIARPFTAASPWNAAIPASPVLDSSSAEMARRLGERVALALFRHAVPVYYADERTPARRVVCTRGWGDSPFQGHVVRVPDDARPNTGDNGSLVVIDGAARRSWEFYQFSWNGREVRCAWGGHVSLDGDGADSAHTGAAGGSWLGGLVRLHEIESGRIEHALMFASKYAGRETRHPARKSDGTYSGPGAVPVGARVQLDPSLDVTAIPGITSGEAAIALALQRYGAYCVGRTRELSMLFFAELAPDATDAAHAGRFYSANGLAKDEAGLEHLSWESLRVLARWDGR